MSANRDASALRASRAGYNRPTMLSAGSVPARTVVASLAAMAAITLGGAPQASGQIVEPLHGVVIDARGALATFPDGAAVADPRGLDPAGLPGRGLGLEVGAHVYPLRWKAITFGLGASLVWARGSDAVAVTEGSTASPETTTRFSAVSPQVSLNFGTGRGWSTLSGGLGWASLTISRADQPDEPGDAVATLHYGGGARWLFSPHLGASFDLRFYQLGERPPSAASPGHPKTTQLVVTVGLSIK